MDTHVEVRGRVWWVKSCELTGPFLASGQHNLQS